MKELELYIHIPFCRKKCEYCDFLSFANIEETWKPYLESLKEEIRRAPEQYDGYQVSSVFCGGGTPSILQEGQLQEVMEAVRQHFRLLPKAEISLEANPGTLTKEKLESYRTAGFNRISIGCQSTEDQELARLGRIHDHKTFLESFSMAREAGFENINVDLMSGLPGQSLGSWAESLHTIAKLEPEHISAYSLILEEGTPFYEKQDSLDLPDEEAERRMYRDTEEILGKYGYHRYEISNYAKDGYECRHNKGYWTGVEYLGFGLGSSSLIGNRRFSNTDDLAEYLSGKAPEEIRMTQEILEDADRQAEYMILGLRMMQGVSESEFQRKFHRDLEEVYGPVIEKYQKAGLLQREGDRLAFTKEGISLSNQVLAEFLP